MRVLLVGLVSGLIALAGFAGSANASATIDLIWVGSGTATTSSFVTSSSITLNVVLTAGAGGSAGGGVSIDYSTMVASGDFSVTGFASFQGGPLPQLLIAPVDSGTTIDTLSAAASFACGAGCGLAAGQSYLIGTVTFFSITGTPGSFQVDSFLGGLDSIADGNWVPISPTLNSASASPVPEPGTLSLLGMGLGGLYVVGRRSSQKR
jgi:hypothetical protein